MGNICDFFNGAGLRKFPRIVLNTLVCRLVDMPCIHSKRWSSFLFTESRVGNSCLFTLNTLFLIVLHCTFILTFVNLTTSTFMFF